jgi:IS5 family transposase
MRFLGLGLADRVPDGTTVWLYRERLAQAGLVEALFEVFDRHLNQQGYLARGGQIIDAAIVPVPKQRNRQDENATIKGGGTPAGWADKPARRAQKDTDARWTKKHGKSHYGYKNHISVDRRHKLVRRYRVTDAAVHDSQVVDDILDGDNTAAAVWGDSAYWSAAIVATLKAKGLRTPQGPAGQAAVGAGEAGQQDPLEGSGAGGARVRRPEQRHGRHAGAQHRPGQGHGADRVEEPGCAGWCTWTA